MGVISGRGKSMGKTFDLLKNEVNYFREGMNAYFSWKDRKFRDYLDNPYALKTIAHNDWDAGFNDAERFDGYY